MKTPQTHYSFAQWIALAALCASALYLSPTGHAQNTQSDQTIVDSSGKTQTMGTDTKSGYSSSIDSAPPAAPPDAILLDRVVAVINGDVVLGSDVLEEERFERLQPFQAKGKGSPDQQAMDRVINRTLILQQLKELKEPPQIKEADLKTQIGDLRKHLPACGGDKCETESGWNAVLASQGFTQEQFEHRWRVRMLVLNFIEQRFRAGVRLAKPEIQAYYDNSFVPQFKKRNLTPPPLARVSARIDEILLQQHVNGLLAEWLNSLKDQGNVAILDPQFQQAAGPADDDAGDNE